LIKAKDTSSKSNNIPIKAKTNQSSLSPSKQKFDESIPSLKKGTIKDNTEHASLIPSKQRLNDSIQRFDESIQSLRK